MPNILEFLELTEVSGVPRGSNQGAVQVLLKSDDSTDKVVLLKIEKEEGDLPTSLSRVEKIFELEAQLSNPDSEIRKSDEVISKEAAVGLLSEVGKRFQIAKLAQGEQLSSAQAFVNAMDKCPVLAHIASGYLLEEIPTR